MKVRRSMKKPRSVLAFTAGTLALVSIAACSSGSSSGGSSSSGSTAAKATTQNPSVLTVASAIAPNSLNPALGGSSDPQQYFFELDYDSLMRVDSNGNV